MPTCADTTRRGFEPESVRGQIVVVGGVLLRDPSAIVHGGVQNIFGANFGGFAWLQNWMHRCLLYGRPLAFGSSLELAWTLALGFLAFAP